MSQSTSNSNSKNPLKGAVEIIQDRLFYCALKAPPSNHKVLLRNKRNEKIPVRCFSVDEELIYWNFFLDFGPLNLGQLYRFTIRLNALLQDPKAAILFYSSTQPDKRTNAIYLICAWQVLELKRTPEQAMYGFDFYNQQQQQQQRRNNGKSETELAAELEQLLSLPSKVKRCSLPPAVYPLTTIGANTVAPLPPFHDASPVACTYHLTLLHCLQGLVKARQFNFFDWDTFDVEEYEYYEQVENGDLNWIIQDKILAFAGPSYSKVVSPEGYCTLAPSDYIPYFTRKKIGLVVRLNKKNYDEKEFTRAGIAHLEQFYLDGSCPPMKILQRVLKAFEAVPPGKGFAVHCKAGLGRTGTCIGAYMMKHYRMTAPEVIAWMRICRPGCVIGPQQQFLQDLEPIMWQEGEMMEVQTSIPTTNPPASPGTIGSNNSRRSVRGTRSKRSSEQRQVNKIEDDYSNEVEKEEGRPGQADGLLAARHRRNGTSASAPTTTTTATPKRKSKDEPVPITPESVEPTSSSSSS